jgi:hypothetical protein
MLVGRRSGGEPLWVVPKRPAIFVSARTWPQTPLNRRLPGTLQRVIRFSARQANKKLPKATLEKTSRAVIRGSRPFNTVFGLPRAKKNTTRSLDTFQSGSPPVGRSLHLLAPGF